MKLFYKTDNNTIYVTVFKINNGKTQYHSSLKDRLPNQFIREVNQYLLSRYDLYEYYQASKNEKKSDPKQVEIKQKRKIDLGLSKRDSVILIPLDNTFLIDPEKTDLSDKMLKKEYLYHESEGISFEQFQEYYQMEMIDEMRYIALSRDTENLQEIEEKVKREKIYSYRKFTNFIMKYAKSHIIIGDHVEMWITTENQLIKDDIIEIIKFFNESFLISPKTTGDT